MEINNVSVRTASSYLPQIKSNTAIEGAKANRTEPESIWRKLASKYDVHSITMEETANLSQELYDAGEISLLDHAILSFNPDLKLPYGTGFLTQADNKGNHDLISEYENRIEINKKMGNRQSLVNNERVLEYLERLATAKKAPINITA